MPKKLATFLIFSIFQLFSIAQVYNFQYLNSKNGLPQSQAYAICFDNREFAWLGTQGGGIAVYNGESTEYITQENGLISNRIYDLKWIDSLIFCASKGGVTILNTSGTIKSSIPFKNAEELAQCIISFNKTIWVGSNKGLYTLINDKLIPKLAFADLQINSFFIEENDKLWVCSNKGIWQANQPVNRLNSARGLRNENVTSVVANDKIWIISTYGSGLWYYDKHKVKRLPNVEILNNTIIHSICVQGNKLWIATMNKGLFMLNLSTNNLTQYTTEQGLSNNHVRTLKTDYWGNLWIGTSGGGVSIFNNSPFVTYNKSNGLYSNYIYSVLKDKKKNLWVSTQGLGVQKINDTSSVLYNVENGFKSVKSRAIYEDSQNRIWLGTEGEGLSIVENILGIDTIYNFKRTNGLGSDWVKCFAENARRRLMYLGSANGMYQARLKVENVGLLNFSKIKNDLSNARINDLKWHKQLDLLLFASNKGVGYVKKNKVVFFSSESGFRNVVFMDSVIYCGSIDMGVLEINYINDSTFNSSWLSKEEGLRSNNIYQLSIDGDYLWVGSEKGLSQWSITKRTVNHFGYDEGFEGVETNVNATFKDAEGQIWFGTTDGLYVYSAGSGYDSLQKLPPKVYFDDIQLFYESLENTVYAAKYKNGENVVLDYTDNHIGFSVKGHHFTFQNKIKYRWKLEGVDTKWSPSSTNKTATFSNLKPGAYKMLVQASIDNEWGMNPISFEFSILTPIWQKRWFILTYIILSILIIGFVIFTIIKRQRKKNRAIVEKIELEKSVLELEQKALRLQMNPHFIFNVLNSIHHLIILNDSSKARYALSKFSKLMRQVLENSREKLVSIDDEMEMIQNYVQLEKLTGQIDFEFNINIDEMVDTNELVLPPLMVQPFIENAIIHGFKNIDYSGIISVSFVLESDNYLVCLIEDNGSGRANAGRQKAQQGQYHKSTALQVTQERLANLNNSKGQKDFNIEDLFSENNQPIGTRITIRLKLP